MVQVILSVTVMCSEVSDLEVSTSSCCSSYDASVEETSTIGADTEGSLQEISESDSRVSSLLRVLRSPTLSQLARKRKIQRNPSAPPTGIKGLKAQHQVTQRVLSHLIV